MNPTVKKDIINVLEKVIHAVKINDFVELVELSNHVIHDASIFQDDDSLSFAILVYSLSKTIQHCCEQGIATQQFQETLKEAYQFLTANDEEAYASRIHNLFTAIQTTDNKLKLYIEEVINKAKIKKGSEIHRHGVSIARTAEILGIPQWELLNYIGKTLIPEMTADENVKERLKHARALFT